MSHTPPSGAPVAVALAPHDDALLRDAIERAGGRVVGLDAEDPAVALIWQGGPAEFPETLPRSVRWVQLGSAGVEKWFGSGVLDRHPDVQFTSATGAYATTVAEHALALLLAGVRYLPAQISAQKWSGELVAPHVGTLRESTVTIVGAGGIGRALIPMLGALGAHVVAVNRSGTPVPGAMETVAVAQLGQVWAQTDHVVIAAPATVATRHLVGAAELGALKPTSWVINVARGDLLDTDAVVAALTLGAIGGVGLDVTDPEPLPDDHPLWDLPNAIITPHVANPPQRQAGAYADRVAANVARFAAGQELIAPVDRAQGY
ncbi:MAG TPA: D-isomer specific 2-hydroxyacid dehydrogenase family protein [Aldersonia sp.]